MFTFAITKINIMIRLNVFMQVPLASKSELLKLAKELVKESLKDSGCIAYDLFESSTHNDVVMICETWNDEESLKIHSESKHFTSLVPRIDAIAPMKIEKFTF